VLFDQPLFHQVYAQNEDECNNNNPEAKQQKNFCPELILLQCLRHALRVAKLGLPSTQGATVKVEKSSAEQKHRRYEQKLGIIKVYMFHCREATELFSFLIWLTQSYSVTLPTLLSSLP
jgi:hypothetical protein